MNRGNRSRTSKVIGSTTTGLSNADVVVYCLYKLGGASRKVYTEEIAWNCYQISPDRFSWRLSQFRHLPDKDIVRVALTDAAKGKYGRLVKGRYGVQISGRDSDGWQLTPEGAKWILRNETRIAKELTGRISELPPKEVQRFGKQIRKDPAVQSYFAQGMDGVTAYMFTDFLGCSPDAPLDIVRKKYERILTSAELARDNDVIEFLGKCREKFKHYFPNE